MKAIFSRPTPVTWAAGLLLLAAGCSRPVPTPVPPTDGPSEQKWIIGAIATDLAGMATACADPGKWTTLPAGVVEVREPTASGKHGDHYSLTVKLPGGEPATDDLQVTGSVWSPELYVPVARGLLARLHVPPPAAASADEAGGADLLKTLANPLTPALEACNQRLSARLQANGFDADAHEQAALLLGTLAMRDNAGLLWDPRGLCNRATAHLAFARTLRPQPSKCGEVAELLIGLITDTKADCQRRIAALQSRVAAHPELGPWVAAATMRNTRDYRILPGHKDTTFLERTERFRAMAEAISAEQAIARTADYEPRTAPDWSRIILEVGYGVNSGHRFAMPSVALEMTDAALIFPALKSANSPDRFAAILNQTPGFAVQLGDGGRNARWQVIDQGTWARYFQRHLLQAADETYNFLQNKWGVPDEAKAFRDRVGEYLKPLTLYPLCLENLGQPDGGELFPRAADLLNQHPESVSDNAWAAVVKRVPGRMARGGAWRGVGQAWFSPALPTGTVYGYYQRVDDEGILPKPDADEMRRLYAIAPLHYGVCRGYLNAVPGGHATPEQFREVMGPFLPYHVGVMWNAAYQVKDDPARYSVLMNQAAALNPVYYLSLGNYEVEHHREPEAAQAYQNALDHGADAVSVSNSCGWLVNYYYDHGQTERALQVARFAADVYSSDGLQTMAGLMERMGRDQEAESWYEKLDERYHDPAPLSSFYMRASTRSPAYAAKMKAMERAVFPAGMQDVTLAQLSGKPADGVLVHDGNAYTRKCGLKPSAIIVGLDGKRVHSMPQYMYVRAAKTAPEMDLLVYQDGQYQQLHAVVPGRRFNLEFTTWPEP